MLTLEEYERLNPTCEVAHESGAVRYLTPSSHLKWRVDSLFEKEPSTIEWIARFRRDEILVDVGANVGMYTVWAAKTRGVRVYAFEPEAQNYALLNRNLVLNELGGRVKAYCLALSDAEGFSELHLSDLRAGGSCHSLGERVDFSHRPMDPAYSQGCLSARLDDLVSRGIVPEPHYVKIDVDGFEPKVIAGAAGVLRGKRLKSLLVEINQNLPDHLELVAHLHALGYRHDPAQVQRAVRRSGPFIGCAEYVFERR
ncbi:MAG TPA: FkbM family methyltransferase [Burkholderiales bacterium]|nr:FkbM family methyltransferase [Burkholderiales bacterium]